jgi:hypothetical protein
MAGLLVERRSKAENRRPGISHVGRCSGSIARSQIYRRAPPNMRRKSELIMTHTLATGNGTRSNWLFQRSPAHQLQSEYHRTDVHHPPRPTSRPRIHLEHSRAHHPRRRSLHHAPRHGLRIALDYWFARNHEFFVAEDFPKTATTMPPTSSALTTSSPTRPEQATTSPTAATPPPPPHKAAESPAPCASTPSTTLAGTDSAPCNSTSSSPPTIAPCTSGKAADSKS